MEDKFIKLLEANIKSEEQFRSEELHKISLSAFTINSAELDKTLLSLSVGSVGFLLTFFLNDYSLKNDFYYFILSIFFLAIGGFSFTIYRILEIFRLNNDYYKSIISLSIDKKEEQNELIDKIDLLDSKMENYDKFARYTFIISIILSAFFIIMITFNKNTMENKEANMKKIPNKENNMLKKKSEDNITIADSLISANESASGLLKVSKVIKTNTEKKVIKSNQDSNNSNQQGN